MKKPTLRFRQVFEHPTHFKVVKPLGNPLLIAKKGLSPGTQARLRAFAQGGEVRNYDDGGNVVDLGGAVSIDPQEAANQQLAERMREISSTLGNLSEPVAASSAALPAPSKRAVPVTVEAQAAPESSDVAAAPAVSYPEFQLPPVKGIVAPSPAAPTLNVKTYTEPAPGVAAPVGLPSIPRLALSTLAPAAEAEPVAAPPATQPAVEAEAVEAEKEGAQEPVAAEEPAPVEEAAPAAEKKPPDVLTQLMDQLPGLYKGLETAESNLSARRELIATDEMKAVEKRVNDARAAREQAWNDYQAAAANEKPYLSRGDALSKIGTAVSLAAGAFASGMTGMPNYALQIFNQASAADLERQKENKNSLYHRFVAAGADVKEAEDLVQAFQIKAFASKMEDAARATTNAKARIELTQNAIKMYGIARKAEAEADAKIARAEYDRAQTKNLAERLKLDQDKAFNDQIKLLADIAKDKSRSESDRQRAFAALLSAASRAAGVGAGAGRAAAPASGTEDKVEIGGELVTPLRGKLGIGEVQDQIAGRNTVTREALALSQLFKEQGNNIWNLDNPARDLARAKLSLLIENYPKAVGFKRAISLNAAKKLEQALDNPAGLFSAFRNFFGDRPPSTAIDALYESIKQDRDDYLTQKLGSDVYNNNLRAKLYAEDRAQLPVQTVTLGGP